MARKEKATGSFVLTMPRPEPCSSIALGELRDRTHENQRHRACELNLGVESIVLWNTVSLERAVSALRENGQTLTEEALAHLSPFKWDHISLTGDYRWPNDTGLRRRKLRPLGISQQVVPIRTSP